MGRKGKYRPPKKTERAASPIEAALSDAGAHGDGCPYVSRGGLKLRRALDEFAGLLDPGGMWCADLGCSTGGFSDCLLQAGAARVFCVDTAYGELAWRVRNDERSVVLERSNAVHVEVPSEVLERGGVDLVVIDLGWTAQQKAIPAALRWVRGGIQGPGASLGSGGGVGGVGGDAAGSGGTPGGDVGEPDRGEGEGEGGGEPRLAPGPGTDGGDSDGAPGRIVSLIKPHYEVDESELGEGGVLDPVRAEAVTEAVCAAMPRLGVRVLGLVESPVLGGKKKGKGTGNREWLVLLEPVG